MENSGGNVWFESKQGEGTTFFVEIPKEGMQEKEGEKGLAGSDS
jgi:signal transduction histidine kinase